MEFDALWDLWEEDGHCWAMQHRVRAGSALYMCILCVYQAHLSPCTVPACSSAGKHRGDAEEPLKPASPIPPALLTMESVISKTSAPAAW